MATRGRGVFLFYSFFNFYFELYPVSGFIFSILIPLRLSCGSSVGNVRNIHLKWSHLKYMF